MKKFKPLYTFASLWKQFVLFTKNWRRKPTGELVVKDKLEAFENIVDKDGHKRFIEGTPITNTITGVTFTYKKWSLSGTHLMIVVAGTMSDEAVLGSGYWVDNVNLPSWVMNKIYPISSNNVAFETINARASDWSSQIFTFVLQKESNTKLRVYNTAAVTLTKERGFRLEFDLLIDNAESE